jgi:hypothetical protein
MNSKQIFINSECVLICSHCYGEYSGKNFSNKMSGLPKIILLFLQTILPSFIYLLVFYNNSVFAASQEPFLPGYSMGNNGTIIQSDNISGRQPWIPACFYADSFRFGFSASGIDYYDLMDNMENSHIGQVVMGLWYCPGKLTIKGSYSYFNALNIYNEQQGFCSIGFHFIKFANASLDITGYRAGLSQYKNEHETFLHAGTSVFIYGSRAAVSFSCKNLSIKKAFSPGFEPDPSIIAGIYAYVNKFGSQGMTFEICKVDDWNFKFSMGESYCLFKNFYVCGAVSTNPLTLHFGCTLSYDRSGVSLSFVNHPVLGWSKGLTMDYAYR